jgi:hypothetical protein
MVTTRTTVSGHDLMHKKILMVISLNIFLFSQITAQPILLPTALQQSIDSASFYYTNSVGKFFHLLNGAEHIEPNRNIVGHPYFGENEWLIGDIHYNGILFTGVLLKYNIFTDNVSVNIKNSKSILHYTNIDYINIQDRRFAKIEHPKLEHSKLFEIIYKGETKAICRREKQLNEKLEKSEIKLEFKSKEKYYVIKDDNFYQIRTFSALLNVFKENKKEIKDLFQENNISFRRQKEYAIFLATQYYDQYKLIQ